MTSYKDVSAFQGWGPYDSRTTEQHLSDLRQRSALPNKALDALYFWVFDDDIEGEALALLPGDLSDSALKAACDALGWRCTVYREPLHMTTKEPDND